MTPEGKVKKEIKAYLDSLGPDCRYFMPQNMGMGEAGVSDIIGVWHGKGFAIEVKAPKSAGGKLATPWQERFLEAWRTAGGLAIIARCVDDVRKWMA